MSDTFIPVVGEGVTECRYSDSVAMTIVEVTESGKTFKAREDKATLLNGIGSGEPDALVAYPGGFVAHVEGTQRYAYEADPSGSLHTFRLHKDGNYVSSTGKAIPGRHQHYDYNF